MPHMAFINKIIESYLTGSTLPLILPYRAAGFPSPRWGDGRGEGITEWGRDKGSSRPSAISIPSLIDNK
jgi:hypothetical protein